MAKMTTMQGGGALGVAFVCAFVAGAVGIGEPLTAPLMQPVRDFTMRLADAHYDLQRAVSHVAADGSAEFAVLPRDAASPDALAAFAAQRDGWGTRPSAVRGWHVVSVPPRAVDDALAALRDQPFVRAALRNRGLWICH